VAYGRSIGLFGGKNEDELRASGTPTTARVSYVDDTGKRREGGAQLKAKIRLQIDSGAARGRELEKSKWVPAGRLPRVGEVVQIRFDPDDVDDWAWGDAEMYAAVAVQAAPVSPAAPGASGVDAGGFDADQIQKMIATAFEQGNVSIEQSSHVIDASGDPELRAQILGTLRAHGIDVDAMQAGGLPAAAGDPLDQTAERLKQVDELLAKGLISQDEHREQRQRIIDSV
jgi:hypothetical protein